MCGIFGLTVSQEARISTHSVDSVIYNLFHKSERRGKDSAGIAIENEKEIRVYKQSITASRLTKKGEYNTFLRSILNDATDTEGFIKNPLSVIGHSRMETNGSVALDYNNQPVIKDSIVLIHNGIIVNGDALWKKHKNLKRQYDVDTEIINSLINKDVTQGLNLVNSVQKVFQEIKGAASIGLLSANHDGIILATNTGSLYLAEYKGLYVFSSEFGILTESIQQIPIPINSIDQIKSYTGAYIHVSLNKKHTFSLQTIDSSFDIPVKQRAIHIHTTNENKQNEAISSQTLVKANSIHTLRKSIEREYEKNKKAIEKLTRCTKCILPETMPFIQFDKNGVCNYCRSYTKIQTSGEKKLEQLLSQYRKKDRKPDCIVTFSGGRDSSYGLHLLKKEFGMNPIAYTYDWGMITDLGRRNQSRMTASLGVEHVLISADIQKKRKNIKKNVEAWLKQPDLGTVPLFMAGDKQYFYFANVLKKEMDIDLVILCENPLERTDFKSGYCGIPPKKLQGKKYYALSTFAKLQMAFYYAKQYITNPSYLNSSLIDTIGAFISYYFIPHDYLSLFDYIHWKESIVEPTLLTKYEWETAEDTNTTWRIGDGTAAFYNYIYYTMAGFSENDTFRSNQVREGEISREKALEIAHVDNTPRIESLQWYTDIIGINLEYALEKIHDAHKRYTV